MNIPPFPNDGWQESEPPSCRARLDSEESDPQNVSAGFHHCRDASSVIVALDDGYAAG
jgi:hypothetical protein